MQTMRIIGNSLIAPPFVIPGTLLVGVGAAVLRDGGFRWTAVIAFVGAALVAAVLTIVVTATRLSRRSDHASRR